VRELHEGRYLRLVSRNGWEFVERPGIRGIVLVVAVTPAGDLLLVEQRREAVDAVVLELPAGLAGDSESPADEPLEEAARRELVEETGWAARSMERIAEGPPSAGVTSEIVTLFRARGLERVGPGRSRRRGDHGARGPARRGRGLPREARARGVLVDPKVWAGLLFARRP
jgi:NUDIX domain.